MSRCRVGTAAAAGCGRRQLPRCAPAAGPPRAGARIRGGGRLTHEALSALRARDPLRILDQRPTVRAATRSERVHARTVRTDGDVAHDEVPAVRAGVLVLRHVRASLLDPAVLDPRQPAPTAGPEVGGAAIPAARPMIVVSWAARPGQIAASSRHAPCQASRSSSAAAQPVPCTIRATKCRRASASEGSSPIASR